MRHHRLFLRRNFGCQTPWTVRNQQQQDANTELKHTPVPPKRQLRPDQTARSRAGRSKTGTNNQCAHCQKRWIVKDYSYCLLHWRCHMKWLGHVQQHSLCDGGLRAAGCRAVEPLAAPLRSSARSGAIQNHRISTTLICAAVPYSGLCSGCRLAHATDSRELVRPHCS